MTDLDSCYTCGRRIRRGGARYVVRCSFIVCSHCIHSNNTSELHALVAPTCPIIWHDAWDHSTALVEATRAGAEQVITTGAAERY